MMNIRQSATVGALALACMASVAQAAIVTETFTAEVVDHSTVDWAQIGARFTGRFSYDTEAPIAFGPVPFPDGPLITAYDALSMTLDFGGGRTLAAGGVRMLVIESTQEKGISFNAGRIRMGETLYERSELSLILSGPQTGEIQTALPSSMTLSDYPLQAYGGLLLDVLDSGNPAGFSYQVTSLSPVPEVSAGWLALVGLACVAWRGRPTNT